jgi:hypothetical protein
MKISGLHILYCFPFTEACRSMSDWAVIWQAIGVVTALVIGSAGVWKILVELRRIAQLGQLEREDRQIAAALKRTEFFLGQHRRLFDDSELFEVLSLVDDDNLKLASKDMWDKKRKLLTFFEEIALLVKSKQINADVACYMFGYYARCVRDGKNFQIGIDTAEEHWGLFYWFAKESEIFSNANKNEPLLDLVL